MFLSPVDDKLNKELGISPKLDKCGLLQRLTFRMEDNYHKIFLHSPKNCAH